jgi:ubiquitin carboxyl-terminal hydrolase 9/24
MTIPVEIKGKKTLQEGLELFVQGEMLEGENAFRCDRCDKKVDTLKRCCIKRLPNVLIIVLKRFDFDFETLRRNKLHQHFEFDNELNMKNYCQETLAKKELEKKIKDENISYGSLSDH